VRGWTPRSQGEIIENANSRSMEQENPSRSAPRLLPWPQLSAAVLLLVLIATINAVAIWGMISSRSSARTAALKELELQTLADVRAVETVFAALRRDLRFLAGSPPFSHLFSALEETDPMVRRWSRLEVEATLLLFLEGQPAIERLALVGPEGEVHLVAGRRAGVPVVLAGDAAKPVVGAGDLVYGRWALSDTAAPMGWLEVWLDPRSAVTAANPELAGRIELATEKPEPPRPGELAVHERFIDDFWQPPLDGWLVRREAEGTLLQPVETLAGRFRTTVVLNLAVVTLSLILGLLAFREVRRAARLEAEAEHRQRVSELERQLIRSERLASVGRLAAGIAHEINNPLEGMTNHLALLEDDLAHGDPAAAAERVPRVREGLERTAGVVRQVLTFSTPGEAATADVDLGAVVAETVAFLASNPLYRELKVRFDRPSGIVGVRGNPITLGQLFLNLLINACEAQADSEDKGVEVRLEREGESVVATVADRGPGFSSEALEHLFEPFFSTRDSTGLGLAVSHGIVREHGGEIRAQSRPGGGAEVEVRLPGADPDRRGEAA